MSKLGKKNKLHFPNLLENKFRRQIWNFAIFGCVERAEKGGLEYSILKWLQVTETYSATHRTCFVVDPAPSLQAVSVLGRGDPTYSQGSQHYEGQYDTARLGGQYNAPRMGGQYDAGRAGQYETARVGQYEAATMYNYPTAQMSPR